MKETFFKCLPLVAYFSMEIGIDPSLPTYSGGLGVLAGDSLRAAADLGIPMVAVTLLYRKGYFRQKIDEQGRQTEEPYLWSPEQRLEPLPIRIKLVVEDRSVEVGAWKYVVRGVNGHVIPVYFLDTHLPENTPWDQSLTDSLYAGDQRYRLCQEVLLGLGGIKILRALGHPDIRLFHMNEGHSALLTLALLEEYAGNEEKVRQRCVFTTHTPVPAGHDQFPAGLVLQTLGKEHHDALKRSQCLPGNTLNMTHLALAFSRYINGVAMRHGQISRSMFPHYPIDSITNGVHATTWASPPFSALFDRYIPDWRRDNFYLRHAISIPLEEIRRTHEESKILLFREIEKRTSVKLDPHVMTLGFARRATAYKRADLLFRDLERLKEISHRQGFQIIYAGKAHPQDEPGKVLIRHIFEAAKVLKGVIPVVYLEEYDMALANLVCSGVDLWVNTPQKPQEASGTSGMKAAINGIPSLSILDGWWVEGHIEGVTGWSIGNHWNDDDHEGEELDSLYSKLENIILPLYYQQPKKMDEVRQSTIALNGSFFHAQRMMLQYLRNSYLGSFKEK